MPSLEQSLVGRAQPQILAARARHVFEREASWGCTPHLAPFPVQLEPPYRDLTLLQGSNRYAQADTEVSWVPSPLMTPHEPKRFRIWVPPDLRLDWVRGEHFLRQLQTARAPLGLELSGNATQVSIAFMVHTVDVPVLRAVFRGWFHDCELSDLGDSSLSAKSLKNPLDLYLRDFYPLPPYSHRLTTPDQLRLSPLEVVLAILSDIPDRAFGVYQILFQPVRPDHNWHRNVELLQDLEYAIKLMSGSHLVPTGSRYPQQAPSGDLHQMSADTQSKAHNDKPFYAAAIRTAVFGEGEMVSHCLEPLASTVALYQHGGGPLRYITEADYQLVLSTSDLQQLLSMGLAYRPGFLLNSAELAGLVHLPPGEPLSKRKLPIELLPPWDEPDCSLLAGTPVGTYCRAGIEHAICIPPGIRRRSTHVISRHGMGKSTLLEHMVLHDLKQGHGVAVFDPHGDLVRRLMQIIEKPHVDRVINFNPGDPDWVPLWNPLHLSPGQDRSRTADDLAAALKHIVQGWGDRLEYLLRNGFFGLTQLAGTTMLDLADLLAKTEEGKRLRRAIVNSLDSLESPRVRDFWKSEFDRYSNEALGPPQHKLSKLLLSGTTSHMLSQPENRIDLRHIMDNGQILLVNLSALGTEAGQILGSFLLSIMHTLVLCRSDLPMVDRHPFHIFCDEAHRFITSDLEHLLVETRKYAVDITLAHQYLRQFKHSETDALASAGTTIIFNVDTRDAGVLLKDLRGEVKVDDLIGLDVGEAFARVGTQVVRLNTFAPMEVPSNNFADLIVEQSRQRYCRPVGEVRIALCKRQERWNKASLPMAVEPDGHADEELAYDEFD